MTVHDASGFEAPHTPPPTVISQGGPVLTSPRVVPIFFMGDTAKPDLEDLLSHLPGAYWSATTSEYGVGALTIAPSMVVTAAPPTDDGTLQSWLATLVPTPDPSTIYTVFLPANVTFTFGGMTSCMGFGGYHSERGNMVYALVPRCPSHTAGPLDVVTAATSHELIEAATDPHPGSNPAFNAVVDYATWANFQTELGDMCEFVPAAWRGMAGSHVVQRTWSNAAAAAGHDPCVPAPATPYVAAAPVVPTQTITVLGQQYTTRALIMPVGTTQTIEVDLFSDAPTGSFSVALGTYGQAGDFTASWDSQTGNNGDKLHLTLTRTKDTSQMGVGDQFEIDTIQNGLVVSQWWVFTSNQ
jgi:hypothetical protein